MVLLKSDETRTEFECPACGKHRDATRWSFPTEAGDLLGQSQALMLILTWSSPIVHKLYNGSSECNEQPYSGKKCLPCPGIEPETICFLCSCSNHWFMRQGQFNKEQLWNMHCLWVDSYQGQSSNALLVGNTGMPLDGVFQQKLVISWARTKRQCSM